MGFVKKIKKKKKKTRKPQKQLFFNRRMTLTKRIGGTCALSVTYLL